VLDAPIRRLIEPVLDWCGAVLARLGLGANGVTVAGFVVGMGSWAALCIRAYALALALILLNRLADGLVGAVAPRRGLTDPGGYLDIVLALLFYAGAPSFFAVGRPAPAPQARGDGAALPGIDRGTRQAGAGLYQRRPADSDQCRLGLLQPGDAGRRADLAAVSRSAREPDGWGEGTAQRS